MEKVTKTIYDSPLGDMIVGSFGGKLCICDWAETRQRSAIDRRICRVLDAVYEVGLSEVICQAIAQLDEYFRGSRKEFSIPLLFTGSEFQCKVWTELVNIPFGKTVSYKELAHRIGNPGAVRAVAAANATNPISIFVPCHRVIGSDRRLTGYGGGLDAKQWLLSHEASGSGLFL